jgi:hypothetical protein
MKKIATLNVLAFFLLLSFPLSAQITIGADDAPKPFSVLELRSQLGVGSSEHAGLRLQLIRFHLK